MLLLLLLTMLTRCLEVRSGAGSVEELYGQTSDQAANFSSDPDQASHSLMTSDDGSATVSISLFDHGATCDGHTPDTAAFRKAFAAAEAAVRGAEVRAEVRVPASRKCVTGPFNISNRTTLYLELGSTVKATDDPTSWAVAGAVHPWPTYGPNRRLSAFVGLFFVHQSGIAGPGSLDMNGEAWHGGRLDPKNDYRNLPHFVVVYASSDVLLQSVLLLNGACWNVHLYRSTRCTVDGVTIKTPFKGTDGIDVDSSSHVSITNTVISNGDDCIALKSGWDCFGIRAHLPTTYVHIQNMTCINGGSIAVGSEMSGGVANVLIENCRMLNLSGPILSYRWTEHRGGFIRNITASNVHVEGKSNGVGSPDARPVIWVQSNYGCEDIYSKSCWAHDGRVNTACPQPEPIAPTAVADITFRNISGW
eukprot:SAG31_NODE_8194_length_1498_cov_2.135811_2_plen_418_part_01